jgi:hypothetical protein
LPFVHRTFDAFVSAFKRFASIHRPNYPWPIWITVLIYSLINILFSCREIWSIRTDVLTKYMYLWWRTYFMFLWIRNLYEAACKKWVIVNIIKAVKDFNKDVLGLYIILN